MKLGAAVLCSFLFTAAVWADASVRNVQQRLKDAGFYYGEVDGQTGAETEAALRRFQIRKGLAVTGRLDETTEQALGLTHPETAVPPSGHSENDAHPEPPAPRPTHPVPPSAHPSEQPAPDLLSPRESPRGYADLFRGTIYERSPLPILQNILYAVQGELLNKGLYRAPVDGRPNQATVSAVMRFQQEEDLAITGRLNMATLDRLQVLPGQRHGPPLGGYPRERRLPAEEG